MISFSSEIQKLSIDLFQIFKSASPFKKSKSLENKNQNLFNYQHKKQKMSRILSLVLVAVAITIINCILFFSSSTVNASSSSSATKKNPQLQYLKRHVERKQKNQQQRNNKESEASRRAREEFEAHLSASFPESNIPNLAPLRNDTVTLSGFDGGASFAQQFHIAYSSFFQAGAFLSTIPYLCAEGTLAGSTTCLEEPWLINNAALYTEALTYEADRTIDPLSNLNRQYVYIGASPDDTLVNSGGSNAASSMYQTYLGAGKVETDFALNGANHAWITSKYGNACGVLGSPYISNCATSFALNSMNKMFAHMGITANAPAATFNTSDIYTMSQKDFGAIPTDNSLANSGFVFAPPQCVKGSGSPVEGKCHLHIHFHGCNQSSAVVYDQYVKATQLNEFAVANDVVIFYPQATPNDEFLNPMGCFDFYGFEYGLPYPLAYATQVGGQVRIMKTIMNSFLHGFI